MEIIILEKCIAARSGFVVTLLGVKELIARGVDPEIISSHKLTPRAAEYWAEIQKRADKL